jgi:hypothetical protein
MYGRGERRFVAGLYARGMRLAVCVETVDAELNLGEDATDGIQLMNACSQLYHLRYVKEDPSGGACMEEYRRFLLWSKTESHSRDGV